MRTTETTESRRVSFGVSVMVMMIASACSAVEEPAGAPEITALTPPAAGISVGRGFSSASIVAISRSSTFNGAVELSAENVPHGLLISFAPSTLTGTATLSEVTVTAISSMAPGAYPVTSRAGGAGVQGKSATMNVTVTVPELSVASAGAVVALEQGATSTIPITVTRSGGFTGAIGLTASGLPAGVTASFAPAVLDAGTTTSQLTISAPLDAPVTTASTVIRAAAQGLEQKTVALQLTVQPTTTPAIVVSATPTFVQVLQGQTGQTTVSIERLAGFSGEVAIDVTGLPATVTATAPPIAAGASTTTLQFDVAANTAPGSFTAIIGATGNGIQPASTNLTVQALPIPGFSFLMTAPGTGAQTSEPIAISIAKGGSTLVLIATSRVGGFTEPVAFTIEGLPAGVTTNAPETAAANMVVRFDVAANAVTGTYAITVKGVATGGMTRTGTINLTVQ